MKRGEAKLSRHKYLRLCRGRVQFEIVMFHAETRHYLGLDQDQKSTLFLRVYFIFTMIHGDESATHLITQIWYSRPSW